MEGYRTKAGLSCPILHPCRSRVCLLRPHARQAGWPVPSARCVLNKCCCRDATLHSLALFNAALSSIALRVGLAMPCLWRSTCPAQPALPGLPAISCLCPPHHATAGGPAAAGGSLQPRPVWHAQHCMGQASRRPRPSPRGCPLCCQARAACHALCGQSPGPTRCAAPTSCAWCCCLPKRP